MADLVKNRRSLDAVVRAYLVDGVTCREELAALISECTEDAIEHPSDFLFHFRHFLAIIFLAKLSHNLSDSLRSCGSSVFDRFEQRGYWETFQIGETYLEIGALLLGKPRKKREPSLLFDSIALKEMGYFSLDGAIPQPLMSAQLALNWFYLGMIDRDEKQVQAGLKVAHFLLRLCDGEKRLFHALWVRESESDLVELIDYSRFLFDIAGAVSGEEAFALQAKALASKCAQLNRKASTPFISLLARAFEQIKRDGLLFKVDSEISQKSVEMELGFLRYDFGALSLACTASGVNTGLGALHKKGVRVVSFGPHFYPLADSERYGFYRRCCDHRGGFEDVRMECHSDRCHFKGWSRLVLPDAMVDFGCHFSSTCLGDQWMWFNLFAKEDVVDLTVKFPHFSEEAPLAFVFFISAEKILIEGEQPLIPGVIDQFRGQSAPMRAVAGDDELKIAPKKGALEMQIIPLAGKNHFWGASFLVAFPVETRRSELSWTF